MYEIQLKHFGVIAAEHKNKRLIQTQVQTNKQTQQLIEELWNPGQALRCSIWAGKANKDASETFWGENLNWPWW